MKLFLPVILAFLSLLLCQAANNDYLIDLMNKAQLGDANAQVVLGGMYLRGDTLDKDVPKAVDLLQKAFSSTNLTDWNRCDDLYLLGCAFEDKTDQNSMKLAIKYFLKAALLNDQRAQRKLVISYQTELSQVDNYDALVWALILENSSPSGDPIEKTLTDLAGKVSADELTKAHLSADELIKEISSNPHHLKPASN